MLATSARRTLVWPCLKFQISHDCGLSSFFSQQAMRLHRQDSTKYGYSSPSPLAAVHTRRPGLGCRINQQMPLEARSYDVATVSRARCSTVTSSSGLDVRARPTCPPVPPAERVGFSRLWPGGKQISGTALRSSPQTQRRPLIGRLL